MGDHAGTKNELGVNHHAFATKVEFLEERLKHHIDEYKEKRNHSRYAVSAIRLCTILLGGITTTILGLKGYDWFKDHQDSMSSLALILSAIGTMVTAWDAFADYTWKWVRYRTTLANLYDIRDEMRFAAAGNAPIDERKLNEYFEKLKAALKETNEEWMSKRVKVISGAPAPQQKGDQ